MKILFLARATLYSVYGGDTVQILSTARYLRKLGVQVTIKLVNEPIHYTGFDLIHIFNLIRPADFIGHIKKSGKPYVASPIFVDYADYQKQHATGIVSSLSNILSPDRLEYAKALARWVKNGERVNSTQYLLHGHRRSVQWLAVGAQYLLPNSESEYRRFTSHYGIERPYQTIPYAVDTDIFPAPDPATQVSRDDKLVLSVSRIEGRKNQLNLIKALNNTGFKLKIVGKPAPNHLKYYEACRNIAAANISFEEFTPQEELINYYLGAKVHALPSWHETCGLSSLEAGYYNCNLVITDKGDTVDYFGRDAWYCDPDSPESIYNAIAAAAAAPQNDAIRQKVITTYNWQNAARQTLAVYESVLGRKVDILNAHTAGQAMNV